MHPALATLTEARFCGARHRVRPRADRTSSFCVSSTASRRGWWGRCWRRAPAWSWISRPTSGSPICGLYERYYGAHPAPALVPRFVYGLADVAGRPAPRRPRHRGARLLRDRGAARAVSAGRRRAGRAAVAVRGDRIERRGGAAASRRRTTPCGRTICSRTRCSRHRHEAEILGPLARVARRSPRRGGAADGALGPVRARHLPDGARLAGRAERAGTAGVASRRAIPAGVRRAAVRAPAGSAAGADPRGRNELRAHPRRGERGRARGAGDGSDRQPGEGRGRPGDPGDELGAGAAGDGGADGWRAYIHAEGWADGQMGGWAGGASGEHSTLPSSAHLPIRPSALLPVYAQMPVRPVSGHGSWLVDEQGEEWLDAYGGHAVASTGHSHPRVVQAIAEQAATLLFYSTAVPHPNRERLADRLAALLPRSAGPPLLLQLRRGGERERARTGAAVTPAGRNRLPSRRLARPHRRHARGDRRRQVRGRRAARRGCRSRGRSPPTTSPRSMRRWTIPSPR